MSAPGRSINRSTPRTGPGLPRTQTSRIYSLPAPVGGINASAAISNMPETDALVMDNFFPQPTYVELRNGYSNWSTGLPGWVESLLGYSNATGDKLFAISVTSVYEVTSTGAVGAAVVSSLTNARWEYVNFATSGGQFLYAGNGVDKPLYYDGTSWVKVDGVSVPAITGVTTTKLRNPAVWKNRIWWVEQGSMRAWYLPTSSIGGAAASFDLGPIFRLGGQLHVIFTAQLTDGSSFDDYLCFMSSQGEIAIYRGTDPATAGLFVITGVYPVGKPIGRRCFFRSGADTILVCSDGLISLQKLISVGRFNNEQAISYKINMLVGADVAAYSSNFGWQGVVHPFGNKLLLNVPQSENSRQYQYVENTTSNAWCTFGKLNSPWNAACFCVLGNSLYFGGSTVVGLADSGQTDAGSAISGLVKTAFSYLRSNSQKMVTAVRPAILTDGDINPTVKINVDFQDVVGTLASTSVVASGAVWNTAPWDTTDWSVGLAPQSNWLGAQGVGFAISLYFSVAARGSAVQLAAADYLYQPGGVL